jgi:hypothetical protein
MTKKRKNSCLALPRHVLTRLIRVSSCLALSCIRFLPFFSLSCLIFSCLSREFAYHKNTGCTPKNQHCGRGVGHRPIHEATVLKAMNKERVVATQKTKIKTSPRTRERRNKIPPCAGAGYTVKSVTFPVPCQRKG